MVERYAHVAPETLQGAAARLDVLGKEVLGYDEHKAVDAEADPIDEGARRKNRSAS